MTDRLQSALTGLYAHGDLEQLRGHLLHSSAWIQHQFTAYGGELITQSWMDWLARAGLSRCEAVSSLINDEQRLDLLELLPEKGTSPVRLGLWSWHNGEYFKRLVCQVDTQLLCRSLGVDVDTLASTLPGADPLVISDYDQQAHPHSVDVCPTDLLALPDDVARVVAQWWALWQTSQLANVQEIYAREAEVHLPGVVGTTDRAGLIDYCADWSLRQRRRFCQPESVLSDHRSPGAVAILWSMEGSMESAAGVRRVRVPVISRLAVEEGKIRRETMLIDEVALQKDLRRTGIN